MANRMNVAELGGLLKRRRKENGLSLRDVAELTGVGLNTLSRVERGHVPDLRNFRAIVDWLDVPAETFFESEQEPTWTPSVIARHLRADPRLSEEGAGQIAELVHEMYTNLTRQSQPLAVHLRSASTFTPAAGALLAEMLSDMQATLLAPDRE